MSNRFEKKAILNEIKTLHPIVKKFYSREPKIYQINSQYPEYYFTDIFHPAKRNPQRSKLPPPTPPKKTQ